MRCKKPRTELYIYRRRVKLHLHYASCNHWCVAEAGGEMMGGERWREGRNELSDVRDKLGNKWKERGLEEARACYIIFTYI